MTETIALFGLALLAAYNMWKRWQLEDQVECLRDSVNYLDRQVANILNKRP